MGHCGSKDKNQQQDVEENIVHEDLSNLTRPHASSYISDYQINQDDKAYQKRKIIFDKQQNIYSTTPGGDIGENTKQNQAKRNSEIIILQKQQSQIQNIQDIQQVLQDQEYYGIQNTDTKETDLQIQQIHQEHQQEQIYNQQQQDSLSEKQNYCQNINKNNKCTDRIQLGENELSLQKRTSALFNIDNQNKLQINQDNEINIHMQDRSRSIQDINDIRSQRLLFKQEGDNF
ncbi:hypothetical protein PPERSA_09424 [Pseudocohnilembus persalinus]|uniref:Uncharacterized protein n=1 Tax=Pseudocohnilembus persalinus TaxID=266149 RepID=A0A0V0Q9J5_PSEPJ|nr:hypothetical protein PPERSA_09424 [Pseudocohnilembus persalinus]|eukprot:KRW98899.1 hypothetical protein PPERSA_09424 [Pseudocohnilembus persalinus]